ncbi:hypothetical protein ACWJJH_07570 [Endozoicomonadaceae bacterium StTr2]
MKKTLLAATVLIITFISFSSQAAQYPLRKQHNIGNQIITIITWAQNAGSLSYTDDSEIEALILRRLPGIEPHQLRNIIEYVKLELSKPEDQRTYDSKIHSTPYNPDKECDPFDPFHPDNELKEKAFKKITKSSDHPDLNYLDEEDSIFDLEPYEVTIPSRRAIEEARRQTERATETRTAHSPFLHAEPGSTRTVTTPHGPTPVLNLMSLNFHPDSFFIFEDSLPDSFRQAYPDFMDNLLSATGMTIEDSVGTNFIKFIIKQFRETSEGDSRVAGQHYNFNRAEFSDLLATVQETPCRMCCPLTSRAEYTLSCLQKKINFLPKPPLAVLALNIPEDMSIAESQHYILQGQMLPGPHILLFHFKQCWYVANNAFGLRPVILNSRQARERVQAYGSPGEYITHFLNDLKAIFENNRMMAGNAKPRLKLCGAIYYYLGDMPTREEVCRYNHRHMLSPSGTRPSMLRPPFGSPFGQVYIQPFGRAAERYPFPGFQPAFYGGERSDAATPY